MRLMISFCLILAFVGSAAAQITTTTTTTPSTPVTVYENTASILDSVGNLVVVDSGATYNTTTTGGGRPFRGPGTPITRITVIQPGGSAPMTQVYNAAVQLVGAGQLAVYAVAKSSVTTGSTTSEVQNLIAINPQLTLPAAISAFPNWPITTRAQVQLDHADTRADYISIVDVLTPQLQTTATTSTRGAVVVQFTGGANGTFVKISTGTLP